MSATFTFSFRRLNSVIWSAWTAIILTLALQTKSPLASEIGFLTLAAANEDGFLILDRSANGVEVLVPEGQVAARSPG
jgi:hypothetical protein